MTKKPTATPAQLQQHARELATAFDVRLIESAQLQPHEALALPHLRVALVTTIGDETTYAVALHELGHLIAPTGYVGRRDGVSMQRLRTEEDAAWAWARHYALIWTPLMESVATWAEGTYLQLPAAPAPTPTPPEPIDWSKWK